MTVNRVYRLGGLAVVLTLSLAAVGAVYAQDTGQQDSGPANAGIVLGEVDRCKDGAATPAPGVNVTVDGGPASLDKTDSGGQFSLSVAAGTYTVVATADDGAMVTRGYVPVEGGAAIDVGILQLGGGAGGCGTDSGVTAPALPTFTPTAVATLAPTAEPTPPPPTATPVPPTPTPEAAPAPEGEGEPQPESAGSGG